MTIKELKGILDRIPKSKENEEIRFTLGKGKYKNLNYCFDKVVQLPLKKGSKEVLPWYSLINSNYDWER